MIPDESIPPFRRRRFNRETLEAQRVRHEMNKSNVAAGLPPDYSFDDDRAQFKALMQEMAASRQVTQRMIESVGEQNRAVASAITDLSASLSAPKRIVKDSHGRPVGVENAPGQ